MGISLADVMKLELLSSARVISPDLAADRVRLDNVSLQDVTNLDAPANRELCLVSVRQPSSLARFLESAKSNGAAAVAVSAKQSLLDLLVETLGTPQLPVILLPEEVKLTSVADAVSKLIEGHTKHTERPYSELSDQVLEAATAGHGLNEVSEIASRWVGRPCVLLDSSSSGKIELKETGFTYVKELRRLGLGAAVLAPVRAGTHTLGLIAAAGEASEFSSAALQLLKTCADACVPYLVARRALSKTELRLREDFVWSLASGVLTDAELARLRCCSLGYDPDRTYQAVAFMEDDAIGQNASVRDDPESLLRFRERMLYSIEKAADVLAKRVMATVRNSSLIAFLEVDTDSNGADVRRFCEKVLEIVGKSGGPTFSCGIGRPRDKLLELARGYEEAKDAVMIGRVIKGRRAVTQYADLGPYRLLARLSGDDEACEFCSQYLGRLIEYDSKRKGELLRTLSCYLANSGNVSATARTLHLHRQSLIYRLERIEQLTGLSLQDAQDRFVLELGLRLYDVITLS